MFSEHNINHLTTWSYVKSYNLVNLLLLIHYNQNYYYQRFYTLANDSKITVFEFSSYENIPFFFQNDFMHLVKFAT